MERDRKNDKVQNIREEYDRLFREHYRSITFIAFNYLKDEARAENVAQDVFMKLWEERDKLDFSKSLFPWLSTVTRNQCLNILKGDKVRLRYRNERYQKAIELKEDLIRNSSDFILHHKEI